MMKHAFGRSIRQVVFSIWAFGFGGIVILQAAPAVRNLTVGQRQDGSGLVDIHYDLAGGTGPITVMVSVLPDGGPNPSITPHPAFLSGDVGYGVASGPNKHIVWNAAGDRPDIFYPNCKIRVIAVDADTGGGEHVINLPGGVPLVLVRIPSGSFDMGSPNFERSGSSREGPLHKVTIAYDFFMGKYELTQAQWQAVMGGWPSGGPTTEYGVGPDYPAYYVSWNDAKVFIAKLNDHIEVTGQGSLRVRLPSEAEWEYACRARTQTRFSFGDSLSVADRCEDDLNRSRYMWYCGGTKPVGSLLPNGFGLFDMHGNVQEWCEDPYHDSYTGAPVDGSVWAGTSSYRVNRGGYWGHDAEYCRSAYRRNYDPTRSGSYLGFRLAAD